ncbi:hypothetical protein K2173_008581 [Erythroxylum novogranatense]|uniref:Glycosyltransferase n=1 Tax=Erythroxylum novogranatense TaxID=1862640 RepID=A0AAV8SKP6_9ROSI|nr:hypothetical protein K2173_008581 [Erythroxylum novogranatense]
MEEVIVLYPNAGRGHLDSMVELGKLIINHYPSLLVTVVISGPPHEIPTTLTYTQAVSATTPSITFLQLPTVTPPPITSFTEETIISQFFEIAVLNNSNLHNALLNVSKTSKIKALVLDLFCASAFEVSTSLNIPTYFFYTSGASGLCMLLHWPTLVNDTTRDFKAPNTTINIPGVPPIPSEKFPLSAVDRSSKVFRYFEEVGLQMTKSAGIIVNTFDLLEQRALEAARGGKCTSDGSSPPIYCLGPIVKITEDKAEHDCLTWLESQPSNSVLFLCFGSGGVFSAKQTREIAIGLESSGVRFLWVVRDPLPEDGVQSNPTSLESFLPDGFMERTKTRGFIVKSWAPQAAILNHGSVGGLVTHCGWNSILEAVCAGVPMLAWPLYAEQHLNRVLLVEELKVALPVNESENRFVSAHELEMKVRELQNSETGKCLRDKVAILRKEALMATNNGGSSRVALAKLVESFRNGFSN